MGLFNMSISRAKRQAVARKAARTRKTKRRAAAKRHIIKKSPL